MRIQPGVSGVIRPVFPVTDSVWERLRRCESGGRYDVNTGNGFYGAYQFVPRARGEASGTRECPTRRHRSLQDEAAQALQARSGWGQWPACARKLGLR